MSMWAFLADRASGAAGGALIAGAGAGFLALIGDTEGDTVGLHSQG